MIRVRARSNESVQQLIRRFNKICEKEGLNRDIKRNSYYEKPSQRRRRKERKSRKRALAAMRERMGELDSAQEIVVQCRTGVRSAEIVHL